MERIRVLLIDDNRAFLDAATNLLTGDPMIEVVGRLLSPKDAVGQISVLCPDVVLLELEMSEMSGLLLTLHVKAMASAPKIVLVADHDEPIYQNLARAVHVDAFVSKRSFFTRALPVIKELVQPTGMNLSVRLPHNAETGVN